MSALAAGMGLDLGGGASFRGAAIGALLDDVAIAARHGELQKDEADLVKRILQGDGIDNGRRVTTFLLQRRRLQRATAAAAAAAVSAGGGAARASNQAQSAWRAALSGQPSVVLAEVTCPASARSSCSKHACGEEARATRSRVDSPRR